VNQIKAGQQVEITLDALPDAALQGAVSAIAPAGTSSSGVVTYPVTVNLTGSTTGAVNSPAGGMALPSRGCGLSAA